MNLLSRMRNNARLFSFTDARYGLHKFGEFEAQTIRRMFILIKYLRQIETNPRSWHESGFLNRIDNELAVLLYRRAWRNTRMALVFRSLFTFLILECLHPVSGSLGPALILLAA
jgi:hypothetical protein